VALFSQVSPPKSHMQLHFLPSLHTPPYNILLANFITRITFDHLYKSRISSFHKFLQPPVSHSNSARRSSRQPALELPHSMFLLVYRITLYELKHSKRGSAFNFRSLLFIPHYYSKYFYSDTFYKSPDFSLQ
jgi:hypothetical protein